MPMRRLKKSSASCGLPTVNCPAFSRKNARFSRKEQAEAIEVHLLLVHFHLREIRVVRRIERQARRDRVLQVEAGLVLGLRLRKRAAAARLAEHVRRELQVALARHANPLDRPGLGDLEQIAFLRQRRPERDFVVAANPALEVEAPGLHFLRAEAQGCERDLHLGAPADVGYGGAHGPRRVPILIEAALAARHELTRAFARDLTVVLHAGRRRAEHVAVLAIEQAVDQHAKAVGLLERRVAAAVGGDDLERLIVVGDQADVQRAVSETDEDHGALARGGACVRLDLPELIDRVRALPRGVARDVAVDRGRGRERHRLRDGPRRQRRINLRECRQCECCGGYGPEGQAQ